MTGCQRILCAGFFLAAVLLPSGSSRAGVDYNRDVLPILAGRCFPCHGVDEARRKAKLRLDVRESAIAAREAVRAIVPGEPERSALVRRIFSGDEDEVMPPPGKGEALSPAEKKILREWIAEGAVYRGHWAFQRPEKAAVPARGSWGRNTIDRFIHARLVKAELEPQGEASRGELLRRVTLDLTGLPPTIEELDAFLADKSPAAYEKVVDGLLTSPRFGERLAIWWLDGARYGDSHGYDNDLHNSQWPWRDWVIRSFNANKPYDQFTIEQLAGDLLEEPTNDQVIATGFNRNHRINTEGGAIDEEWRTEYVIDRVETMGTVWMGLSLGCARCHEHKYDPLSQEEFYRLFAFFNQLDEKGFINNLRGSAEPRVAYKANPKVQVMIMREMKKPRKTRVLEGGQYDAPGEEVTAGLPAFLPTLPEGEKMSRLGLARWLVNGRHLLTARVLVNRLWEQLFGTGIVRSVENLGIQAEWPSHPALLDWLAGELIRGGWRLKPIHKLILISGAYRQSAAYDEARAARDPLNRFLWRRSPTRLEAEIIRDSVLKVSGLLDTTMFGKGTLNEGMTRRSIYFMIKRSKVIPSMQLFDSPEPLVSQGSRPDTIIAPQALLFMNSPHIRRSATRLMEKLQDATGANEPAGGIAQGYRLALGREPTATERGAAVAFFSRQESSYAKAGRDSREARRLALIDFCQVLFGLNEFIYIK